MGAMVKTDFRRVQVPKYAAHIPQTIIKIPNKETIHNSIFGYFEPLGIMQGLVALSQEHYMTPV